MASKPADVHKERLTPTQERILGYIAAQTIAQGSAQITKKGLADMFHCSVKTVDRAISRLRIEGYIVVDSNHIDNGGQVANSYRTV